MLALAPLLLLPRAASLDDLLADAWKNSPDVARAEAVAQAADAETTALSVLLPNPELEGGAQTDLPFGDEGEVGVEVALLQELAWPGARLAKRSAADGAARAARLRLSLVRLDVAARVEAALGDAVAAVQTARVRTDMAQAAAALEDGAKRRAEAGAGTGVESALASAERALAEAARDEAHAAVDGALAALHALLGETRVRGDDLQWPALAALPDPPTGPQPGEARVDVRAAALDVEAARRGVEGAALDRLPRARLGAGYAYDRGVLDSPGLPADVVDGDHLATATLSITLPVWDWRAGEIARARAQLAAAEADLVAARRAAAADTTTALSRFRAAASSSERLAAVDADVARALDDVQRAYLAGALALDDALTTRDRLLRARLGHIDAQRRKVASHAAALSALADPRLVGIEVLP